MIKYVLSFGLILSLISLDARSQEGCDLKKDADGIQVYLCDSDLSNFRTIIVELDMPATMSQYAAHVLAVENYKYWHYKSIEPYLLDKVSDTEIYYYSEVETPWPVDNRDLIFHLQMSQNSLTKILTVKLTIMPDYIPHKDGVVRLPQGNAVLKVTPIDKNNVHIRYIIDLNPGGAIPAWVANMFAAKAPWQTYYDFRERIIAQGENRITVPFIQDY